MTDELFSSTPAEPPFHEGVPQRDRAAFPLPPVEAMERAPFAALTPGAMPELMRLAVEKGGVEALERLVALNERMMDREASRQFTEAMSRFKSICPPVPRRSQSDQFKVIRAGIKVNYSYASLEDIESTIRAPLGQCGLAYRWGNSAVDKGMLTIPCIVAHVGGHSISSSASYPLESRAGCSEAQKYGSTEKYAQRHSLILALGLTSCEDDTDGAGEQEAGLTPEQVAVLTKQLALRPAGSLERLLDYTREQWGACTLDQIPASQFEYLKGQNEAKIKAGK